MKELILVFFSWTDPIGGWRPGLGDPTFLGWVTVFAYFFTAWLCWRQAHSWQVRGPWRLWVFWSTMALLLLLLGVNKQLDLQTAFTILGRKIATSQGWYENRRMVQAAFILLLGIVAGFIFVFGLWWFRPVWSNMSGAWIGLTLLGLFVLIRAASFHHIDQILGLGFPGLKVNTVLELGGVLLIGWTARPRVHSSEPLFQNKKAA